MADDKIFSEIPGIMGWIETYNNEKMKSAKKKLDNLNKVASQNQQAY